MAAENKFTPVDGVLGNLNGLFKQIYADKLQDLIPDGVKLLNMIKFSAKDKTGDKYNQPVILGMEHGVTFAASEEDAFALNPAVAGQIKNAEVRGNALVLRSVIGYKAISSSVGSEAAFQEATKYLVANMLRSVTKKLEIEMLYGAKGYGKISAEVDAIDTDIQIKDAEWAPGIWAGAEGMPLTIVRNGIVVAGGGPTPTLVVSSVNFETKTITLRAAVGVQLQEDDDIFHFGALGKEFKGIHAILEQQAGDLFNINQSTYNLFRGNVYDVGGEELSFDHLNNAIARAVEKGLDSKVVCMVNPRTWADLLTEQAALRRYDQSYSSAKLESGSKGLLFHSQNGEIEIIPSIYVKEGFAYMIEPSSFMRVGSQDVSFKRPGFGDDFFRELDSAAGFELRCYCDQALFTSQPAHHVLIKGIVNNQPDTPTP
jgi:hypothetical protein